MFSKSDWRIRLETLMTKPIATDWTQNPPLIGTTQAINSDPTPVDNPPAPDATDLDDQNPDNAGDDPTPTTWTPAE